jgi:hypothetical protein
LAGWKNTAFFAIFPEPPGQKTQKPCVSSMAAKNIALGAMGAVGGDRKPDLIR